MLQLKPTTPPRHPQGFTLIELLMVIVVISILVALIVPATGGAIRRARITGVVTEITQLEAAIAKFKADHGVEPPSSINFYEQGTVNAAAGTAWGGDPASVALVRQIWPQFNFGMDRDLNGNGMIDTGALGTLSVSGSECLVIFLGGTYTYSATAVPPFVMNGFSKDPTNPLAGVTAGSTREKSLFEFKPDRLSDVDNNGVPEYLDSIPGQKSPYLYYSSYDGQGYASTAATGGPRIEFVSTATYGLTIPYAQGAASGSQAWKSNSHQIISPGFDGVNGIAFGPYGYGGAYTPTAGVHLAVPTTGSPTAAQRINEADNITNFSNAELGP